MSEQAASILDVSSEGLILDHGDRNELASWTLIDDISVATVMGPVGKVMFVMAIRRAGQRVVMCHEKQCIWEALIDGFADYLPNTIPFEAWGPALVGAPDRQVVIYMRQPMGSA